MKKMLLLLLVAICTIGWRSETIMQALGMLNTVSAAAPYSIQSLTAAADKKPHAGMSLTEYAALTKIGPNAYHKLFQSHQQDQERSEIDKLMNFFTRLKFE